MKILFSRQYQCIEKLINIIPQNAFQLQAQNNFLNPYLKIYFKAILSNYMNINKHTYTEHS